MYISSVIIGFFSSFIHPVFEESIVYLEVLNLDEMAFFRLSLQRRLMVVIFLSTSFFAAELVVGFTTHSLAIIADAFHYLGDIFSLVIALVADKVLLAYLHPIQYFLPPEIKVVAYKYMISASLWLDHQNYVIRRTTWLHTCPCIGKILVARWLTSIPFLDQLQPGCACTV